MQENELTSKPFENVISNGPFPIRFPCMSQLEQDQEWCEVLIGEEWTKVRFHDYTDVYKVPGLYETLFYRTLMCNSPNRVTNLLGEVLIEQNQKPSELRVLDFGAGNGMEGEALQSLGTRNIVGVDIISAAKEATMRDRPWVYDNYLVCDMTDLSQEERSFLENYKFNALTVVAALGFGDIPALAFYNAYDFVEEGGFVAFNIRSEFLKESKSQKSDFSRLIQYMIKEEIVEIELYKRYQHRLNIAGEPIYYIAIIAKKLKKLKKEDVKALSDD